MRALWYTLTGAIALIGIVATAPGSVAAQALPVRAVLFFSPTCPHCHQVINEDLPVIFERFGGKPRVWTEPNPGPRGPTFYYITNGTLEILLVDASQQAGGVLYETASAQLEIPPERMGVPRLVVDGTVLVGSLEIPSRFPDIIERALDAGGLDWPAIDGLVEHIPTIPEPRVARAADSTIVTDSAAAERAGEPEAQPARPDTAAPAAGAPATAPAPADSAPPGDSAHAPDAVPTAGAAPATEGAIESSLAAVPIVRDTPWTRFRQDPVGNGMAVVVLLGMLWSLWSIASRAAGWSARDRASVAVPALAVIGMGVAAYLTYVETSGTLAVCGPVGDCNAVQQSAYARVGGVPVGLLGLAGYALMLVAWGASGLRRQDVARWATLGLLVMAFVGVLSSIYLTFLEPFVIGATCMWCLTSAVIMTLLLWLVAGPGTVAWRRIRTR